MKIPISLLPITLVLVALMTQGTALANEPSPMPTLRIEPGMHTGQVWGISVDQSGQYLVSASLDKTAIVWDLRSGAPVQVLRPPAADGDGGFDTAVFSPDGATVACDGNSGAAGDGTGCIYLFDRATGAIKRRILGLPNDQIDLVAYSADARYLAVACGSSGLFVYNVADGSLAGKDDSYQSMIFGVSFSPSPSSAGVWTIATTSLDDTVFLYRLSPDGLKRTAMTKTVSGGHPWRVAFSPDGTKLAVGYGAKLRTDVLSAADLSVLYTPSMDGLDGGWMDAVGWSRDGQTLFAGGDGHAPNDNNRVVRAWSQAGQGKWRDLPASQEMIRDVAALPGGGVAYGAFDPAVGAFGADGRKLLDFPTPGAKFPDKWPGFKMAPSGSDIAFAYDRSASSPHVISLANRQLTAGTAPTGFIGPITHASGLDIEGWHDGRTSTLNGAVLKRPRASRSLAIAPDSKSFLLGGANKVFCYDADGTLKWEVDGQVSTWDVNVSADSKLGVIEFGDGTIHWYRMSDGTELLKLFLDSDQKSWIAWTASGYYDCSPGGDKLIGWNVNRSKDQAADYFPTSCFRNQCYRPDVVSAILTTLDEGQAVAQANAKSGRSTTAIDIARSLPPVVTILSPQEGDAVVGNSVTLRYSIRTPSGEPATTVHVLINGRPLDGGAKSVHIVSADGQVDTITASVPAQDCTVSVIADNQYASSAEAIVHLTRSGNSAKQ